MSVLVAVLRDDDRLRCFSSDLLEYYGIDIHGLWLGETSHVRLARLLSCLLMKDSLISRYLGKTSLAQTDSLLIDALDELIVMRRMLVQLTGSKMDEKTWKNFVKTLPGPIEKPSYQPKPPKQVQVTFTPPNEVFPRLHALMKQKMVKSGLRR